MEVDKFNFYGQLLQILTDISESHFVAIDLELSGVPSRQANNGSGRQTLQNRYLETKEAAERFQILQIGLTCVRQDVDGGKYVLKPYNFDLSPLIDERGVDVERIFSFQSSAVEFLLKNGFDIGRPFHDGVPYLARDEAQGARKRLANRQDRSAFADIPVKPTDTESLAFLERVRGEINDWVKLKPERAFPHININGIPGSFTDEDDVDIVELSRFERRLVHQLVRAEFPQLVSIARRGNIQIVRFNKEREERILKDKKRELETRLGRQKGFRWIIEALHGSDLSKLDLRDCARELVDGHEVPAGPHEHRAKFHRAQERLRGNPRMLVGHNCFLDFVYLYRTFIGALPDTVEEFSEKLHALWPSVVDTKYMSTHDCGDINPVSSLQQIARELASLARPVVEVDGAHAGYDGVELFHEAGYDSFLTAQIAVRLSSKLRREGGGDDYDEQGEISDVTNGLGGFRVGEQDLAGLGSASKVAGKGFTPAVDGVKWQRKGEPTLPPQDPDDPFRYDPGDRKHRYRPKDWDKTFDGGMPRLNSRFWKVYGNKLRVFGTEEGVCVLDRPSTKLVEGEGDADEDSGGIEV